MSDRDPSIDAATDDWPDNAEGSSASDRRDPLPGLAEEPIEPGWYAYSGGAQNLLFHLRETGQWSVHADNGSAEDCEWDYIEQALGVWMLDRIPLPVPSPVLNPPEILTRLVEQWGVESIRDAFETRWPIPCLLCGAKPGEDHNAVKHTEVRR